MPVKAPDGSRAREHLLKAAVGGNAWSDAAELSKSVIAESVGVNCWRPGRAALLQSARDGPWMTAAEFKAWVTYQTVAWRKRVRLEGHAAGPPPIEAIAMANGRKLLLMKGQRSATKIEALAMAHYALGLAQPVPCDAEAFEAWAVERFGSLYPIGEFLGVKGETLVDRCRGYDIRDGVRRPRAPEPDLIRAMDWCWRVGPFCPYGDPTGIPVWPGQEV